MRLEVGVAKYNTAILNNLDEEIVAYDSLNSFKLRLDRFLKVRGVVPSVKSSFRKQN